MTLSALAPIANYLRNPAAPPGERLRKARVFSGLSQSKAGALVGVCYATVRQFEAGNIGQSKNAAAVELVFGIPADHWPKTRY